MKVPQLTFTRFLAAMLIVVYHLPSRTLHQMPVVGALLAKANAAVSYFFLLSGFILVVASVTDDTLPRRVAPNRFWTNRFARIYPLYAAALLLTWVLVKLLPAGGLRGADQAGVVLANALLVQAWVPDWAQTLNYPGWSLSVESLFYALFPFLYATLVRWATSRLVGITALVWLLSLLAQVVSVRANLPPAFTLYFPLFHLATFVSGITTGVGLVRHYPTLRTYRTAVGGTLLLLTILFAGLTLRGSVVMNYYHNGLLTPLFSAFILWLTLLRGPLVRWLSRPGAVRLGEISYGIYLLQVPVGLGAWHLNERYVHLGPVAYFLGYVGLLLLVAALSHSAVELPAQRWLRRRLNPNADYAVRPPVSANDSGAAPAATR